MLLPISDYTLTTTLRLVAPYDVKAMNDEFQDAKLISVADGVATFKITYHLFHKQEVRANPNWRQDDATMTEFLRPRPAANWDKDLQTQILKDLKADGIDPTKLDDKAVVEKVSRWALKRAHFNDQFGLWMVEFDHGTAKVPSNLRQAFNSQEPKGRSDADLFADEVFGKGMYLNKTHGACTSSSTYLATVLRAVGIPTRIVVTVPAADGNDPAQVKMLLAAIRHNKTRRTVAQGVASQGFSNHLFNEVFVGGKWIRLNYDVLCQPIVDPFYEGLMTHIYTAADISDIPFSKTWGPRFGMGQGPKLSSVNPYQLLSAEDHVDDPAHFDNPSVEELTSATVVAVLERGNPRLPDWVKFPDGIDALVQIKEWLPSEDYHQLRVFASTASTKFILRASGHPDVGLELPGGAIDDERGGFQAYVARLMGSPESGVEYHLVAVNGDHEHKWIVPDGIVFKIDR